MQVTLKPRRIVLALGALVTLLTVADVTVLWIKYRWHHDYLYGLTPLFDFNREGNLPSFYSACALLLAAVLLLVVAGHARERNARWRRHWTGLGIIFLFLAVDEAAEIHGLLSFPVSRLMTHTTGALLFAWVIPYAFLTLLFVVTYMQFFWALSRRLRGLVGIAGVVYVSGALGLEVVSGVVVSAHGGLPGGLDYWLHAVTYTVEELMEMGAVLLLIQALLEHIAAERITLSLRASSE